MKISPINNSYQQNNQNFKAKLQLNGNKNLLKMNQEEILRKLLYKVGDNDDTVLVDLPSHSNTSGTIWMSRFRISNPDYNCLNVKAYYNNDDAFSGIIEGLNKMNFREHIYKPDTGEYALPKHDAKPKFQEETIEKTKKIVEEVEEVKEVDEDISIPPPNGYPLVSSWKAELLEDYFYGRFDIED